MSLATTDYLHMAKVVRDDADPLVREEIHMLDRYLAVLEDNKRASRFVLDDATLAMDMAGYVQNRLGRGRERPANSAARLALSLMATIPDAPVQ